MLEGAIGLIGGWKPARWLLTGLGLLILALIVLLFPAAARVVRSQALVVKEKDYMLAAQAPGSRRAGWFHTRWLSGRVLWQLDRHA